ncbi:mannose-P-dolichol utilization defect 1 protein-like isoform X1 [Osmerus mordax]|uniref:mannose-P-dolichol utilization defect 1 protein-like isoform X1 n=1 Tax=Osmerus mordax TaxID=8014 RepID=UPI00350E9427
MATSGVETLSPTKQFLLTYLMPEKCYDRFFVDINFMHVPCLKIVLSKFAGVWILLGVVLAQIPQVWTVWKAGNAEGLSLTSLLLQLYVLTEPVVYCMANNFPVSAWSERVFTLLQTLSLVFLLLRYRGDTAKGLLVVGAYCGAVLLLASSLTPPSILSGMQSSVIGAVVASKAVQVWTNYCSGTTGQLSGLAVCLGFTGSLSLIFTSLQETGQSLSTLSHALASCLCCLLLAQIWYYRYRTFSVKEKEE